MSSELEKSCVVFVQTTVGDVPYFRANNYRIQDGLLIFSDGMNDVMYYNLDFVISFGFDTR